MNLQAAEEHVLRCLSEPVELRAEALEALLAILLAEISGASPRGTDGIVIAREEVSSERYFAAAHVYMIADQRIEPFLMELCLEHSNISAGRVVFGVAPSTSPSERNKQNNLLMASPHEALQAIPWARTFVRGGAAWALQA